jgi:hypothetical protein
MSCFCLFSGSGPVGVCFLVFCFVFVQSVSLLLICMCYAESGPRYVGASLVPVNQTAASAKAGRLRLRTTHYLP